MTKKIIFLALCSLLLAPCCAADAQQQGKVFRIGFLDNSTASGSAVLAEAFRQELSKLAGLKEKTSPSNTGFQSKTLSACRSLRRSWSVLRLISLWSPRRCRR